MDIPGRARHAFPNLILTLQVKNTHSSDGKHFGSDKDMDDGRRTTDDGRRATDDNGQQQMTDDNQVMIIHVKIDDPDFK